MPYPSWALSEVGIRVRTRAVWQTRLDWHSLLHGYIALPILVLQPFGHHLACLFEQRDQERRMEAKKARKGGAKESVSPRALRMHSQCTSNAHPMHIQHTRTVICAASE